MTRQLPTREQLVMRAYAHDTVGTSADKSIRRLGERPKAMGKTGLMRDVAERLMPDANPADPGGRWPDILGLAWTGVGAGDDRGGR